MRYARFVGALVVGSLAACGGGGGGGGNGAPANQAPIANAGPDQTAVSGGTVTLNGSGSSDPDGAISRYTWLQTAGPTVTLTDADGASPIFCAPTVAANTVITFSLAVTDNRGSGSAVDTVNVTVTPPMGGTVMLQGNVTFARVPLGPDFNALNYAATRQDPARAITIQAVCGGQQVLASTTSTPNGDYTLTVPANTSLAIRAVAEMTDVSLQSQIRVIDDARGDQVYSYTGPVFNSTVPGGPHNLAIPSGWDTVTRTATGERAAAPFAILETIYKAATFIDTMGPVTFPPLNVDWGPGNVAGRTFYRSGPGTPTIVLAGEANVDTEEYDEHVIAHEFGHYIEDHFSRSDSIGGPHGAGDRLDLRVAFGEGFGYAFAAFVLADPISRDTFGAGQTRLGFFNIDQNSVTNAGWFSEASNWVILWDLFDAADSDDPIQMGFAPIWDVLRNEQTATPALTGVFPFVTALKQRNPGSAGLINQVVSGQGIVSATIDPFGTTESNQGGYPFDDVFPIYKSITVGGPAQTVRSVAPGQSSSSRGQNKLSNHRLLRLSIGSPQNVRFRVTAPTGRDADIVVYRQGVVVDVGDVVGNEDFTITSLPAGEYVLDVYDCENAECTDQASYNYQPTDITVTLTNN